MKSVSIKTKVGWITAIEFNDKIVRVKFAKYKNLLITQSAVLSVFVFSKFASVCKHMVLDPEAYAGICWHACIC